MYGARVAAHAPATVHGDLEVAHRRVAERHVPGARYVERLAVGEVAIAFRADHLRRLDVAVRGAPDIDVGGGIGTLPGHRVGGRRLRHGAEEHAGPVLAPGERRAVADHPAGGKSRGRRVEGGRCMVGRCDGRAHIRYHDQHVAPLAHLRHRRSLEHGYTGAGVVPRQLAVHAGRVVQRLRAPRREIGHEQPVGVAHLGVDGVGEQVARAVEGGVVYAAHEPAAPGREIDEDHVGTAARRISTAAPAPATPTPAPAACRRAVAQERELRVGREGDRLHVVPHLCLARRQLAKLHAVRGRIASGAAAVRGRRSRRCPAGSGGSPAPAARLLRVDFVSQPPRIGREDAIRCLGDRRVAIGVEVPQMQFRLRIPRRDVREAIGVGHPVAVARDVVALDDPPPRVVVDGEDLPGSGIRTWRDGPSRGRLRGGRSRGQHSRGCDRATEEEAAQGGQVGTACAWRRRGDSRHGAALVAWVVRQVTAGNCGQRPPGHRAGAAITPARWSRWS